MHAYIKCMFATASLVLKENIHWIESHLVRNTGNVSKMMFYFWIILTLMIVHMVFVNIHSIMGSEIRFHRMIL